MSADSTHPGRWWHALPDGKLQCDLCPRDCRLAEGQRGLCFVRQHVGGAMHLTTYGRSSGFCLDPIEKKPLAHFYPGSSVLSFGTAGCNLACKFCQNWDISKSRETDRVADEASPEAIAARAVQLGARSVAFTYNDPVIFAEYAIDVAAACHAASVKTVAVTAGYVHAEARRELFGAMDAANVDLKAFSEDFYHRIAVGHLAPVLDTLKYLVHETEVWTEITTLLIPGENDSDEELKRLVDWVAKELGPEVPLHFTAFHPDYRMLDKPPTPMATLARARALGLAAGLRHVYTGNVVDPAGETTSCAGCGAVLVERDRYELDGYHLDAEGRCPSCAKPLAGRFDPTPGRWGRRRLRVAMS